MKTAVLFGGTGFIGMHLTQYLLEANLAEKIVLVDRAAPRRTSYTRLAQAGLEAGRVTYVEHDLRTPIAASLLPEPPDVAFNLAAVHREPGHVASEYFETNLRGAENVCAWTNAMDCRTLVFTSSISPYGPSEQKKTEESLPTPETPYGSSKLAAEKIHLAWQAARPERKLLILRPGVVFGPGEDGNVTRLVRSLVKGYFVYLGNRQTVKAAGYVKELCRVAMFGLDVLREVDKPNLLLNFTMDPPPTMEQIVAAAAKVIDRKRHPLSIPPWVMLALSYPMSVAESLTGVQLPINRVRVRKLIRSNNIWPEGLRALGYRYHYTLESAFEDWKRDCPEDFS